MTDRYGISSDRLARGTFLDKLATHRQLHSAEPIMKSLFYKTLLDDFSRCMNMAPLVFDDKGACNIIIDKTFAVTLRCDGIHQRLLLIGLLEPSKDIPLQLLLTGALNPLVNAGPGIGWDEHSELYYAYQSIPQEALIYSIFRPCNALEALIYLGATAGF
ncbi:MULTISPECIES: CesT family type III secretion system chaperone [Pseudomonas syringae group]|uniref:Type III chaperone protein ShcA n=2 Tax=Pseudomonas syringae group TaxID=136849 RepID=A0A2K4X3I8_PSESX|nr:hypothetical protein ALO58_200074 [Pseudomonas savastanoi pv. savastanoi]RML75693.1 hypothetical protein ALQ90_200316 [Pseudomonas savastanoi pv. savastanoi]RMO25110.1 hypothetical protein ALQ45_200173 [Pseudomonas amygdali pv. morsprunorum]RMU29338.1 hypothetical protein ALP31_200096 [Pseudomonas amygdali pv. morsprunorum]SOS42858.1 hypothetical protein CFBP3840_P200028 [Pseudomonas syringae]